MQAAAKSGLEQATKAAKLAKKDPATEKEMCVFGSQSNSHTAIHTFPYFHSAIPIMPIVHSHTAILKFPYCQSSIPILLFPHSHTADPP